MSELDRAVDTGDPDVLLRLIDQLVERRDWHGVITIARTCRAAVDRGKQLWGVAEHAYYRAALHAPAEQAATALVESPGRFALGPLTEVIAQNHTWSDLAPHLPETPATGWVMAERMLRGEVIDAAAHNAFVEVPFQLQRWETDYVLPIYRDYKLTDDRPAEPARRAIDISAAPPRGHSSRGLGSRGHGSTELSSAVAHWAADSTGVIQSVVIDGSAAEAVAALGVSRARGGELTTSQALALLAWAAASGGAQGRRRGLATGRFEAWWVAARLLELDWPPDVEQLGDELDALHWLSWDAYEPDQGWHLRLAVEDLDTGRAWAISAHDGSSAPPG